MELAGKRVLVLGLGMSGRSAANYCAAQGAHVVAADERGEEGLTGLAEVNAGIQLSVGEPFPAAEDFDLVVPSPGVPRARYGDSAKRAWGDIELSSRALKVPVVAVTGTNGKSTTVRLIESMLRSAGLRARAAGNVGAPALELLGEPLDVAVLEVSSFQLESVESFAPRVAVVLNVTPDHLDRHGDFEGYVAAKRRLLERQRPDDVAVLNFDDPVVRGLAEQAPGEVLPFRMFPDGDDAGWSEAPRRAQLDNNVVVLQEPSGDRRVSLDGMRLLGRHNLENALAAVSAVWALGVDVESAMPALADFTSLPHRCEVVGSHAGVTFVDDSKATNVGAAVRSLEGFTSPVVWIAGGSDKGLDFAPLAAAASGRVRKAFLIGETAPLLAEVLADRVDCEPAETLEAAVREAAHSARPGDVVLLCPACASFDQFASFEERGERFRAAVDAVAPQGALQ